MNILVDRWRKLRMHTWSISLDSFYVYHHLLWLALIFKNYPKKDKILLSLLVFLFTRFRLSSNSNRKDDNNLASEK